MLTLRPELSNLDACDVRETPLTWRSTTGALAYLSLFIIVRRAKAKWQRPQGPVVQSCTRNHSVPQITVSVVRQTAHNMHTACITSCIHVTKNSKQCFNHCWLYAVPRTCNPNIRWVRDTDPHLWIARDAGRRSANRVSSFVSSEWVGVSSTQRRRAQ